MEDRQIIDLFFARSEEALKAMEEKYGRYSCYIAQNILHNEEDSAECVNDALFTLWQKIPPERPRFLKGYLAKIVRNLALSRYEYNRAEKRSGETDAVSEEFWQCLPDKSGAFEDDVAFKELFDRFLAGLDERTRIIFLRRYFYLSPVKEIATSMDLSESNVKVILSRTRNKLKEYLEREDS